MRYFDDVLKACGTEFWINNPSLDELRMALDAGAVGVASNPTYIATLLKVEPEFVHRTIDELVADSDTDADEEIAARLFRKAVSRPLSLCEPLFRESQGRFGYAAIQGNPRRNDDPDFLLREAEGFRDLGDNIIIKMPSTVAGAQVLEELTARGWSTIGTMCFSVSQYIYMAEAHRRGLARTDKNPRCLITMLPGMFSEYLAEDAARRGIEVADDALFEAGIATARVAYRIHRERGYDAIVLSGGSRSMTHWTELLGPNFGITLSGKLTADLIDAHPEIVPRLEAESPQNVVTEMRDTFPDFLKACDVGAMEPEEFRPYGPVVRFQNALSSGFECVIEEIASRRKQRV